MILQSLSSILHPGVFVLLTICKCLRESDRFLNSCSSKLSLEAQQPTYGSKIVEVNGTIVVRAPTSFWPVTPHSQCSKKSSTWAVCQEGVGEAAPRSKRCYFHHATMSWRDDFTASSEVCGAIQNASLLAYLHPQFHFFPRSTALKMWCHSQHAMLTSVNIDATHVSMSGLIVKLLRHWDN